MFFSIHLLTHFKKNHFFENITVLIFMIPNELLTNIDSLTQSNVKEGNFVPSNYWNKFW